MSIRNERRAMLFPRMSKYIIIVFALAFILAGLKAYQLFQYIFDENIKNSASFIIPRGATFQQVTDSLKKHDVVNNYKAFLWVAKKKEYAENIKAGHYSFTKGMNTNQLVNMLKAGNQTPVKVTFNNIRRMEDLAGSIARYLEPDSTSLLQALTDTTAMHGFGFSQETYPGMFIPNTYEFYWTSTAQDFLERMAMEYRRFWNEKRLTQAQAIGLTPPQIITLASIVQEETVKADEKATVAGLYLNRLKRGMLLQADPTVKFALGDFTVRRMLFKHLEIDSPYNTYKYPGLPPGPITFAEISSIDAVLQPENHNYLYMCAREDFSGYHNFATNLAEHNRNARRYQEALNRAKIW